MPLTPVKLRHARLARKLVGSTRRSGRRLDEVAESFEDAWRKRADLNDQIGRLEAELARVRSLETLLRATLVSAERAAGEMRQVHPKTELVVEEARLKARQLVYEAEDERARIQSEIGRLRALETEMRAGSCAHLLGALEETEITDERRVPGRAG